MLFGRSPSLAGCLFVARLRTNRAEPESGRTNPYKASIRAASSAALDFSLLRDLERVVDFDAKVPDCAFNFTMAEQQLDGPEVLRAFVNQRCLGAAHGMCAVDRSVKSRRSLPSMYHPGILPG